MERLHQQPPVHDDVISTTVLNSRPKGIRVSTSRRNPRVAFNSKRRNGGDADALALPLGMSIAAFVAQVLEKKDATGERLSADRLSEICALAVKESLSNVFGDKFDCFVSNFERSFQSTLMTLRVISESSGNRERYYSHGESSSNDFHFNMKEHTSTSNLQEQTPVITLDEDNNVHRNPIYNDLAVAYGPINGRNNQQLASVPPSRLHSQSSALATFERSVSEQGRANDLKAIELGLDMQKLRLKEAKIAVDCDSNVLERFKLSMGISKANFRAEKFKTELQDTRHAQLLKKCVDCLVAGLLIMVACLAYGTYIHSHQRLVEANESCMIKESSSWWIPKPMASFSSGFQFLRCQAQVISRMLFGILMIIAIAFLLIQRSGTTNQTMPVTFLVLLLGVGCGFAGKFCIDTLGGSGAHWLFFWEIICLLHLFANICTSALFGILHGPVTVVDQSTRRVVFPYWFRRVVFYAALLVYLPLLCGLIPFAGVGEWLEHFASLVVGRVSE
ncbi:protein CPR-5-like [Bidens hawaiensis]|uniref:protein CPR-5-like n=1 Tax=Bidens hawaiensis TaxID=980011 RepID=UPI00404A8E18